MKKREMQSRLRLGRLILVFWLPWLSLQAQDNVLRGTVQLPEGGRPWVGRMTGYHDQASSAQSLARNTHVVLYPLDFSVQVKPLNQAVITQKEERFIPQVLMITPGTTVYFLNEDNQYHNVFSRTLRASFNIGRRPPGHMFPQRIDRVGVIKVFCDIHAHMRAYLISVETPYFTRLDAEGRYRLGNLPDGRYRLEVVHPRLAHYEITITLTGGKEITQDLDLTPPR